MEYLIGLIGIALLVLNRWLFKKERERRRSYYLNEYLKSDDWKRKRYVVLRRDNLRCVYCGAPATQVHHKQYARRNIGKEPIKWLVSVCNSCHESFHRNYNRKVEYEAKRPPVKWNTFHGKDQNQFKQKPVDINTSRHGTLVSAKPNLQDWLKNNRGKTINDYFSKFGR
jgi:hypothetical protein